MLHHYPEPALRPVPKRMSFLVVSRGWAGEPAQNRLIDRGATSQFRDQWFRGSLLSVTPELWPTKGTTRLSGTYFSEQVYRQGCFGATTGGLPLRKTSLLYESCQECLSIQNLLGIWWDWGSHGIGAATGGCPYKRMKQPCVYGGRRGGRYLKMWGLIILFLGLLSLKIG